MEKNVINTLLTSSLTFALVISASALCFTGLLAIPTPLWVAIGGFVFSGLIETTVFGENISKGLDHLDYLGSNGRNKIKEKVANEQHLTLKLWGLRLAALGAVLACVAIAFFTATALQCCLATLLGLSLSAAVLTPIIWPLAIIAAIAHFFVFFNTLVEISLDHSDWKTKLKAINPFIVILIIIVTAALTGLNACILFTCLGDMINHMLSCISLNIPLLPTFSLILHITYESLFTFNNIFSCLYTCFTKFKDHINNTWKNKKDSIQSQWKEDTFLQFINPFRIIGNCILQIGEFFILIAHAVSSGATTDRVPWLGRPLLVCMIGGVIELLVDGSYIGNHGHDNHQHSGFIVWPLKIFLSLTIFPLASIWEHLSRRNKDQTFSESCHRIFPSGTVIHNWFASNEKPSANTEEPSPTSSENTPINTTISDLNNRYGSTNGRNFFPASNQSESPSTSSPAIRRQSL